MPYTPSIRRRLIALETEMPLFQIIDPAIKANYGIYFGSDETDAKDLAVAPAGWSSYAKDLAVDAKFNGTRRLEAIQIVVLAA